MLFVLHFETNIGKDTENFQTKSINLHYDTRVAPKVTPHIYFHGNYNRYKEHNNSV
jgi:hypothetical protein